MAKKIVINPQDFEKIIQYITEQPVHFGNAKKAVEIQAILTSVQLMDIEVKPDNNA
jgi:hypothetical protein